MTRPDISTYNMSLERWYNNVFYKDFPNKGGGRVGGSDVSRVKTAQFRHI